MLLLKAASAVVSDPTAARVGISGLAPGARLALRVAAAPLAALELGGTAAAEVSDCQRLLDAGGARLILEEAQPRASGAVCDNTTLSVVAPSAALGRAVLVSDADGGQLVGCADAQPLGPRARVGAELVVVSGAGSGGGSAAGWLTVEQAASDATAAASAILSLSAAAGAVNLTLHAGSCATPGTALHAVPLSASDPTVSLRGTSGVVSDVYLLDRALPEGALSAASGVASLVGGAAILADERGAALACGAIAAVAAPSLLETPDLDVEGCGGDAGGGDDEGDGGVSKKEFAGMVVAFALIGLVVVAKLTYEVLVWCGFVNESPQRIARRSQRQRSVELGAKPYHGSQQMTVRTRGARGSSDGGDGRAPADGVEAGGWGLSGTPRGRGGSDGSPGDGLSPLSDAGQVPPSIFIPDKPATADSGSPSNSFSSSGSRRKSQVMTPRRAAPPPPDGGAARRLSTSMTNPLADSPLIDL